MKKVTLSIQEVLTYQREMIIEVPEEMTDDELNLILNKTERKSEFVNDIPYILKELNKDIAVVQYPDDDLSSPFDSEFEIDDFEIGD